MCTQVSSAGRVLTNLQFSVTSSMHSILKGCSHTQPRCSSSLWRTLNRFSTTKYLHNELITPKVDYEAKYAEKLQKRAAEYVAPFTIHFLDYSELYRRGASVAELRQRLKEEAAKQREKLASAAQASTTLYPTLRSEQPKLNSSASTSASIPARRDSSPIKVPLSRQCFFNSHVLSVPAASFNHNQRGKVARNTSYTRASFITVASVSCVSLKGYWPRLSMCNYPC